MNEQKAIDKNSERAVILNGGSFHVCLTEIENTNHVSKLNMRSGFNRRICDFV